MIKSLEETKLKLTPKTLQNTSVALICLLVFVLPLFFAPTTTDIFYLNKQTFLILATGLLLILTTAKTALEKSVRLTQTPFNLPLILLCLSSSPISYQLLSKAETYPLLSLIPHLLPTSSLSSSCLFSSSTLSRPKKNSTSSLAVLLSRLLFFQSTPSINSLA